MEGKKCYYIKRTLQKDGVWFWSQEIYFGSELIEAGFSIDELLSDYKIEVVKSPNLNKVNTPDRYLYTQEEYEKDLASAEHLLKEKYSGEPSFFGKGFVDSYIQSSVKRRIRDIKMVRHIDDANNIPDYIIQTVKHMLNNNIAEDDILFHLDISRNVFNKIKKELE